MYSVTEGDEDVNGTAKFCVPHGPSVWNINSAGEQLVVGSVSGAAKADLFGRGQ